ncbi:MAG: HAMP domain-containing sensor histidine kinase [Actinomycetota bacterium]
MRISTRTGLAAGAATLLAVVVLAVTATVLFRASANERVDDQLLDRAAAAPVFAAVGDRVAVSELNLSIGGVRVTDEPGGETVDIGRLPTDELPPLTEPGWRTARADGEDWRLYAVSVADVPLAGDTAIVEFVEPLGDVDEQVRTLRRRAGAGAILTAIVVIALGSWWGRRAAQPLSRLANDARRIGSDAPDTWTVDADTGSPEVDDVAGALNHGLEQLAAQRARTDEALEAARAFGASASHELRTPLQSALTNLDVAAAAGRGGPEIDAARAEVQRAAERLSAVRTLSAIDLVGDDEFVDVDVAELAERAVGTHAGRFARVEFTGAERAVVRAWPDGVSLALDNVIRNAAVHAGPEGTVRLHVDVSTDGVVTIDDDGVGIGTDDRSRLLQRFERGATGASGSGLGLTLAARVAEIHGGALDLGGSPTGGLRTTLSFSSPG